MRLDVGDWNDSWIGSSDVANDVEKNLVCLESPKNHLNSNFRLNATQKGDSKLGLGATKIPNSVWMRLKKLTQNWDWMQLKTVRQKGFRLPN